MIEIKNNKTGVPLSQYRSVYREMQPGTMSDSCGLSFDGQAFELTFLQKKVRLSYPDGIAIFDESKKELDDISTILLLRYLTDGTKTQWQGDFIAYSEIPWSSTYIQQFTGRCIKRLAFSYGNRIDAFKACCEILGGVEDSGGDAAYRIPYLENLVIKLILWRADEEFPPSAQILFSDNFKLAFTAEDLAYAIDILIDTLKSVEQKHNGGTI